MLIGDDVHGLAATIGRRFADRPLVVAGHPIHPAAWAMLEDACEVRMHDREGPPRAEELAQAAAMMAFMTERVDRRLLARMPRLEIIAGALKGADNIDVEECTRLGVWVSVCEDLLSAPTAELAMGLLLGLARRIYEGDGLVRSGEFRGWRPRLYGQSLHGATLGIVGMGSVGRAVAQRAVAFGLRVLYCDPYPLPEPIRSQLCATRVELDALFASSDILMPLLPLTPSTRGLIDAQAIAKMTQGVLIVNVARGSLVDESAIADALRAGRLGGYAADVFALEDMSITDRPERVNESLISETTRTLLTPHLGSAVASIRHGIELEAANNILVALAGGRPPSAINSPLHPHAANIDAGTSPDRVAHE